VENHLGQSLAISEINEDHTAMVPSRIYPTGKKNFLADIGDSQFVAVMCSIHD
jgi:hypothetical protein